MVVIPQKGSGTLLQGKTSQNKAVPASPKRNGKGKEIQNGLGVLGPHDDIYIYQMSPFQLSGFPSFPIIALPHNRFYDFY